MKFNNKPNPLETLQNGKQVYLSRPSAVLGIILARSQNGGLYVLANKRGTGCLTEQGKWNVPTGYLDWNETLDEAVLREVYEETGLELDSDPIIYDKFHLSDPFTVRSTGTNVDHLFGAVINCTQLPSLTSQHSEPNEVAEVKWIPIPELDKYEWAWDQKNDIIHYLKVCSV